MNDDQLWRRKAACRGLDTNVFYPERGEDSTLAKAICAACPVRRACGEWAIANNEKIGIWGGVSPRVRTRFAARRRQSAA